MTRQTALHHMVKTLSREEFSDTCRRFAAQIKQSGYMPGYIVGIARGGDYVAAEMKETFKTGDRNVASVKLQRKGSAIKGGAVAKILRRLPRKVNDALRMAESRLYAFWQRMSPPSLERAPLPEGFASRLMESGARDVLIVDDAMDSGVTLASVAHAVKEIDPGLRVRTAVLTRTRTHTLTRPDFTFFPVGTIVRFPWAPDA